MPMLSVWQRWQPRLRHYARRIAEAESLVRCPPDPRPDAPSAQEDFAREGERAISEERQLTPPRVPESRTRRNAFDGPQRGVDAASEPARRLGSQGKTSAGRPRRWADSGSDRVSTATAAESEQMTPDSRGYQG